MDLGFFLNNPIIILLDAFMQYKFTYLVDPEKVVFQLSDPG